MSRTLRQAAVLAPVAVAGLAAALVALGGQDADAEFLYRQQNPLRLERAGVERFVAQTVPEPVVGGRRRGASASCGPGSRAGLKNPWRCAVRYRSGRRATYRVNFRGDGSYVGRHVGGTGMVRGCCLSVPGG